MTAGVPFSGAPTREGRSAQGVNGCKSFFYNHLQNIFDYYRMYLCHSSTSGECAMVDRVQSTPFAGQNAQQLAVTRDTLRPLIENLDAGGAADQSPRVPEGEEEEAEVEEGMLDGDVTQAEVDTGLDDDAGEPVEFKAEPDLLDEVTAALEDEEEGEEPKV